MNNRVANTKVEDALNEIGAIRNKILKAFGGEELIEKAIEVDEFNDKYSSGYQIHTKEDLEAFITDVNKAVEEDPENKDTLIKAAHDSLSGLTQILVKSNDKVKSMWIKELESGNTDTEE